MWNDWELKCHPHPLCVSCAFHFIYISRICEKILFPSFFHPCLLSWESFAVFLCLGVDVRIQMCVSHIQSLCDCHILQILANFNDHSKFHEYWQHMMRSHTLVESLPCLWRADVRDAVVSRLLREHFWGVLCGDGGKHFGKAIDSSDNSLWHAAATATYFKSSVT